MTGAKARSKSSNDDDDGEDNASDQIAAAIRTETNRATLETKQDLDGARQQAFGLTRYLWVGGDCPLCAPKDGQIFTWGEGVEPGDMHPNCQCSAEPVLEGAGDPKPFLSDEEKELLTETGILLAALIASRGKLARAIGSRTVQRLGEVGRRVVERVRQRDEAVPKPEEKPNIFDRPKNVPKEWEVTPTKDGKGRVYTDPSSKGTTYVKVQKGDPASSQPGQRYDNVRWMRNGQSLDKNGNPVPKNSQESHIPLERFEFRQEILK